MRSIACAHAHAQECTHAVLKYVEASITIAIGGIDIDVTLLVKMRRFAKEYNFVGLCYVEGGEVH